MSDIRKLERWELEVLERLAPSAFAECPWCGLRVLNAAAAWKDHIEAETCNGLRRAIARHS